MSRVIFGLVIILIFGCTSTNQEKTIKIGNITEAPSYKEYFSDVELITLET